MKKIVFAFLVMISVSMSAQGIQWMTVNEAIAAQSKEQRPIFIDMYTNWCGPCKLLDKRTFNNKDLAAYVNANFYAVKFNGEGNEVISMGGKSFTNPQFDAARTRTRNSQHEFSRFLGVRVYPTMVFLESNGKLINRVTGFHEPQDLEKYLKVFGTDLYKTVNTQEKFDQYIVNFKPTFKANTK